MCIRDRIYGVAYELPEKLGMAAQFAPLRRAAYEAFSAAYPDEVGLLDSAIFGTAEACALSGKERARLEICFSYYG